MLADSPSRPAELCRNVRAGPSQAGGARRAGPDGDEPLHVTKRAGAVEGRATRGARAPPRRLGQRRKEGRLQQGAARHRPVPRAHGRTPTTP
jgi:hypothetical protein